jgi:hypothetical protein
VSLRLELCGSKDEVLRHNSKLVQHKIVRGTKVCDFESRKGVFKRIKGLLRFGEISWWRLGFVGEGRREA